MRILIIEDDVKLCDLTAALLRQNGHEADCCYSGDDAFYYISQQIHDIILLDRMLPGMDGLAILKKMRGEKIMTPVIMITAMGQLQDKIDGLDTGADDYLVKPFEPEELMARIRCIKRRPARWEDSRTITVGDLILKPEESTLQGPSGCCGLSKRECSLLEIFLSNPDQVMPRTVLLSKVWGPEGEVEDGNLDNYIFFVRRRLKSVGSQNTLATVRGIGYKFCTSS